MRPKKVILLIDSNEDRRSQLNLVLRTHGYRVVGPKDEDSQPDLVLVRWPHPIEACQSLKSVHRHVPMAIVLGHAEVVAKEALYGSGADSILNAPPPSELLERIKILAARRRGPRKSAPAVLTPAVA